MPINANFTTYTYSDGTLTVSMIPPVPIGGWTIEFDLMRRLGGSALASKSVASGFNNQSGINITNSGQGQFNVKITPADTSGFNFGNYAFQINRTDSGFMTPLAEGYAVVQF